MEWNSGMEYGIERCMYTTTTYKHPYKYRHTTRKGIRCHANISGFFESAKISHTFIDSMLYFGCLEGGGAAIYLLLTVEVVSIGQKLAEKNL